MSARLTGGYVALLAALGVAAIVAPAFDAVTWALAGGLGVGAMLAGVVRHRPEPRGPWALLAAGLLAQALGDIVLAVSVNRPGDPTPLAAELCYLAMFPLLAVGLFRLTRPSVLLQDRSTLLDLLIVTTVLALLAWAFVIGPALDGSGPAGGGRSLLAVYAFGDLVLVATVASLLLTVRHSAAVSLLAVGAVGLLTADVGYVFAELGPGWQPGGAAELGWLVLYGAWGAAALHPSMAGITVPVAVRHGDVSRTRIVVLVAASLVPPALLLGQALRGPVRDGAIIAVSSAVLYALIFSRLADAVDTHRRSVARERHLREACASLLTATSVPEVDAGVRDAVARLMPAAAGHRLVFTMDDPGSDPGSRGRRVPAQRGSALVRRTHLLRTVTLQPALIEQLGGFPMTLCCPLVLSETVGAPRFGALYLAAEPPVLAAVQDAVEVVAAQATLALARISVTDRMSRGESEHYFRAISQNSSDVVLVVDDDDRVRYANAALAELIGAEPPPFGPLADLVHPEGREQVARTLRSARGAPGRDGVREDWLLRRSDGSRLQVEVSCRDLRADRMVQGLVITMRDVTERRLHEQELIRRAVQDSAPGRNRRSVANRFRAY